MDTCTTGRKVTLNSRCTSSPITVNTTLFLNSLSTCFMTLHNFVTDIFNNKQKQKDFLHPSLAVSLSIAIQQANKNLPMLLLAIQSIAKNILSFGVLSRILIYLS